MEKSSISKQADNYAEVITNQIIGNFDELRETLEGCDEWKPVYEEYQKTSPNDTTLIDIDKVLKRLKIIENNIGDVVCDGYNTIEPLAVGLFGEWGSGKTHQLKLIKKHILLHDSDNKPNDSDNKPTIIPVFFNAWRFEKEEHIIIPLFQTLLDAVENHERTLGEKIGRSFKSTMYHLKNVLLSLHKGISVSASYKTLHGVFTNNLEEMREISNTINSDSVMKNASQMTNEEQVREQSLSDLIKPDQLESIYLNIPQWIEKITLFENVNFVFLIDDLDRCLPENTLKMLESIKLFLDVPSCAFVLAVDDDVVERGVVHHYRDYLSIYHHKDTEDAKGVMQYELPITGHEYLEKMIQLPIRLPVIDTVNVREFLKEHSAKWIKLIDKKENPEGLPTLSASDKESNMQEKFYVSPTEKLLDFLKDAIPPKPRKIKRTAKLFESKIELLYAMELEGKCSYELLAKITLLELFAPKILRFIQNNYYAETYRALYDFHYVHDIEEKKKKNTLYDTADIKNFIDTNKSYTQEKKDRYNKLIEMISEHHSSRMIFDLSKIFNKTEEQVALKVAIEYRESKALEIDKSDMLNTSLLSKEIKAKLLLEDDPITWGATLEEHNKVLTLSQVNDLIKEAKEKADTKFNDLPFIANPEWVGQIAKFVDNESYKTLLQASHNARFKTIKDKTQIDMFQLTFAEYDKYCEIVKNVKKPKDEGWGRGRRPVINVSWDDATKYIEWLNGFLDTKYALPTEDEWYLACNNGKNTKWHFGNNEKELKEYAWYRDNSDGKTHPVGEKKPNTLGLYDMHGNVWEWCEDWFDEDKDRKVLRGGSWGNLSIDSESSSRNWYFPSNSYGDVGFRLQRTLR